MKEREWAEVEWDEEQERWVTVRVTRKPLRAVGGFGPNAWEDYNKAVKYAEACGLEVVGHPHLCTPGCTHPLIGRVSPDA